MALHGIEYINELWTLLCADTHFLLVSGKNLKCSHHTYTMQVRSQSTENLIPSLYICTPKSQNLR
jgi:hypothetical protein